MDDLRIQWLRNRVYDYLGIKQQDSFGELLRRDDGAALTAISKFLDETDDDTHYPLFFYSLVLERDEQIEVECGTSETVFYFIFDFVPS